MSRILQLLAVLILVLGIIAIAGMGKRDKARTPKRNSTSAPTRRAGGPCPLALLAALSNPLTDNRATSRITGRPAAAVSGYASSTITRTATGGGPGLNDSYVKC